MQNQKSRAKLWKRPFQENKDWNIQLASKTGLTKHVKAPIPRKQGLKHMICFASGFLKIVKAPIPRKQGLKLSKMIMMGAWYIQVKAPIPRKQGLKPSVRDNDWSKFASESAHSKKTRIETRPLRDWVISYQRQWKRPFQENKDWNDILAKSKLFQNNCESAHSKKTRIETVLNAREN